MIVSREKTYLSSKYLVDGYGEVEFVKENGISTGGFRKVRSMIPFEYINKVGSDFDWSIYGANIDLGEQKQIANSFIMKFNDYRKEGKGLYISSAMRGSGKTLLSCCLGNEIMSRYDVNVKFISVLDYLDMTQRGYKNTLDKEEVDNLKRSTVLILDDMGVELKKEWVDTTLYQLINYRYTGKLITVITSNLPIGSLKVDDRIKDRINSMCLKIELPEISIRSRKANEANMEFYNRVTKKNAPDDAATPSQGK